MVDKNQSEDYLTDRDIGVLSKYAQEEKRELYWGYLAAKGDRYAELALGVVHNNTFSGQIANMSLTSHIPEERRIEFTEKHLDDMGIDLMKRDLIARKLDHDHPDKSITTHGGLHLSVTEVRTYHKQWLEEKVHLSPEAWTMELICPRFDGHLST